MSVPPESQRPRWEFANLGFNTVSKLWFLELYNYLGLIETFQAKEVVLTGGSATQYQWPEKGGKPLWHVRERIFSQEVSKIEYDAKGTLVLEFALNHPVRAEIPENFDSITYAYSLLTGKGFVEFRKDSVVIDRIDERWISVENLVRRTTGEYPNIRLMAKKEDIKNIVVTSSCVVIQGNL